MITSQSPLVGEGASVIRHTAPILVIFVESSIRSCNAYQIADDIGTIGVIDSSNFSELTELTDFGLLLP